MKLSDDERASMAYLLRESLRNERRDSVPGIDQGSGGASATLGSISQDLGGYTTSDSRDTEKSRSDGSSTEVSNKRGRPSGRRPVYSGVSATEGSDQAPKPIGLEPVDVQPITKRPVGRPRKNIEEATERAKKFLFPPKTPLSEKEAIDLSDRIPHCLMSYGEYLDQAIHYKSKVENPLDIWGDLTIDEATALSNVLIRHARRNGQIADVVRTMSTGEDYVAVGVAMIPRMIKTVEELKQSPRRRR